MGSTSNIVGTASPHQILVTFDLKPTVAALRADQKPDELMIDWSGLPAGSRASIYLPGPARTRSCERPAACTPCQGFRAPTLTHLRARRAASPSSPSRKASDRITPG